MGSSEGFALRQQALEALEKSNSVLAVALELIEQGNHVEAERLRSEANTQRTISTLLMSEANNLERGRSLVAVQRLETEMRAMYRAGRYFGTARAINEQSRSITKERATTLRELK